jgi:hypothetical protein
MDFAYLRTRGGWKPFAGKPSIGRQRYEFSAPHGMSLFAPAPWYSNEDAARFAQRTVRRSRRCAIMGIGRTLEGRQIEALAIRPEHPLRATRKVVVIAREHGTETAGSFAAEAVVQGILSPSAPAIWRRDYEFHVFLSVNPDGVAHGRAYPQDGPKELSDLHYFGMSSQDPTCRALREYLFRVRPVCLVNYHSYTGFPIPANIFYDKADGMAMMDALIHTDMSRDPSWYVKRQVAENKTMLYHCVRNFGTVLALFELPWRGRTLAKVRQLGLDMFRCVMHAEAVKRRR